MKDEVKERILKMSDSKATGVDGIPAEIWKIFCSTEGGGVEILVRLFNVREGKDFPTDWKIAIVCPVYKGKGKTRERGNYRAVALLSALGKIYSGVLASRLRDWLINNRILSKFQAAFMITKRTMYNIFVINATIDKYLNIKRGHIYWCMVDSIDMEALWFKMRKRGASENMVKCFNPSVWRHLIPGQYCAVGGFSTWVFKFEPESAKHFKYV
jgi:hypothetical protein